MKKMDSNKRINITKEMYKVDFNISKKAKIKSDHFIKVSINDDTGGVFINLPKKYTKEDVIKEYERGIKLDLKEIFFGFDFSLDNIEYNGILSNANCHETELFEESYLLYVTREQKEEILRRIENNEVFINGLYIWIDEKLIGDK